MQPSLPKPILNYALLALYLLLPWVFFGLGMDMFRLPLAPGDGYISGLPTKLFGANLSAWNPYLQAGTFTFKDIGFQFLYLPSVLLMAIFPNPFGYNLLILSHYTLAGFFTFLFLKKLNLATPPAFLAGIVFMFSGFASAHLAHYMIVITMAYLPVLLYAIETYLQSRRHLHLFLAALAFGMSLFGDYPAVSLYIGMVCFPYIWFRALTGQAYRGEPLSARLKTAAAASAVIFPGGLLIAAAQVFPILESLPLVTREKIAYEFFASFSFPIYQLPMLLFPYLFGANVAGPYPAPYFGEPNLMELSGYVGILPLFLAALALLLPGRDRQVYFWAFVALAAFLLALGDSTPLYRLMYRVPLYNMFRVPARNWLEFSFAIAILGAFAAHTLLCRTVEQKRYARIAAALSIAFLALSGFVLTGWDNLFPQLREQEAWLRNIQISSPSVIIPLSFLALSILSLALLYRYRQNILAWGGITLLILADLFSFGHFFAGYPSLLLFEGRPNPAAEYILKDPNRHSSRMYSLNFQGLERELQVNLNMLYGIPAINAYSNIWLKDYGAITTFNLNAPAGRKRDLVTNNAVLSVLSTKYLLTSSEEQKGYIESVRAAGEEPAGETLVSGFSDSGWEYLSPASVRDTGLTLQGQQKEISLVQIPFEIQANALYQVTLDARAAARTASSPLIVDFFGKNYDKAGQEKAIEPAAVSETFRAYRFLISTDERVPKSAHLRIFTYSEQPYEIRNVTLTRLESQDIYVPLWKSDSTGQEETSIYKPVFNTPDGITIYENRNSLPRVRFVEQILPVHHWGDVFYYFWYAPNFNPAHTALVEGLDAELSGLSAGEILSETYKNQKVTLRVRTDSAAFLVLADSWYPGWRVSLNGQETKLHKTYGMLRGVLIGAPGEHLVEFRFVPLVFYLGLVVTFASTLVLFLAALAFDRRKMT